jgi:hypothetical protein
MIMVTQGKFVPKFGVPSPFHYTAVLSDVAFARNPIIA